MGFGKAKEGSIWASVLMQNEEISFCNNNDKHDYAGQTK
jgi:hypothetical protein